MSKKSPASAPATSAFFRPQPPTPLPSFACPSPAPAQSPLQRPDIDAYDSNVFMTYLHQPQMALSRAIELLEQGFVGAAYATLVAARTGQGPSVKHIRTVALLAEEVATLDDHVRKRSDAAAAATLQTCERLWAVTGSRPAAAAAQWNLLILSRQGKWQELLQVARRPVSSATLAPNIPLYYKVVAKYNLGLVDKAAASLTAYKTADPGWERSSVRAEISKISLTTSLKVTADKAPPAQAIKLYGVALDLEPHMQKPDLTDTDRSAHACPSPRSGDALGAYLKLNNPREALLACDEARRFGDFGQKERKTAAEMLREKEERARAREEEAAKQARQEAEESKAEREAEEARRAAEEEARRAADSGGSGTGSDEEDEPLGDHDLYDTLGVHRGSTTAQVRAAFLRLSRTAHPDKGGSHSEFVRIKLAYEVLVDPARRETYDWCHP
ncbi:hypothetical protein JCM3770_004981 [Rhodotorula araucariae]